MTTTKRPDSVRARSEDTRKRTEELDQALARLKDTNCSVLLTSAQIDFLRQFAASDGRPDFVKKTQINDIFRDAIGMDLEGVHPDAFIRLTVVLLECSRARKEFFVRPLDEPAAA